MIVKILRKYAVHQPLSMKDVLEIRYGESAVDTAEWSKLISAFNEAIFLQRRQRPIRYSDVPLEVVCGGEQVTTIYVYPYKGECDIVRPRKGKMVGYQVRSTALADWLKEHASAGIRA